MSSEIRVSSEISEIKVPMDLCLDGPLWQFAGRFWSRPAAQKAALALQQQGWSVTDILCGLWLASQGRKFTGYGTGQVLVWRTRVTGALRNARNAIIKDNPATDQARNCIANSELEAEKVELALAYRSLIRHLAPAVAEPKVVRYENKVKNLALENLQAAAPENAMNNDTSTLLDSLIKELQRFTEGESRSC